MVPKPGHPRGPTLPVGQGPRPVSISGAPQAMSTAVTAPARPAGEPAGARIDPTPEGRRERHRRETFERLVKAAREIMFSRGFADITVQDITDAADVGKGTFFNYFRSKEHVVSRVQEYNRRSVVQAVDEVRSGNLSVLQAMTAMLMSQLCPAGGEWLTYQTNTMRAIALNSEVRALVSHEMEKTRRAHEALVLIGRERGSLRQDVPAADLAMVQQTFMAGLTVLFWIHNTAPTPELVAEVTEKLYALMAAPAPAPVAAAAAPTRKPAARRPKAKPAARRRTQARPSPRTRR